MQVEEDMETLTTEVAQTVEEEILKAEGVVDLLSRNPMLIDKSVSQNKKVNFYKKCASDYGFKVFFNIDTAGNGKNFTDKGE